MKLTLGSDDPPYFGASIGGEYAVARERFGFEEGELKAITRTAVQASFADDAAKASPAQSNYCLRRPTRPIRSRRVGSNRKGVSAVRRPLHFIALLPWWRSLFVDRVRLR